MIEDDEWISWSDDDTGIDDPEEYLDYCKNMDIADEN